MNTLFKKMMVYIKEHALNLALVGVYEKSPKSNYTLEKCKAPIIFKPIARLPLVCAIAIKNFELPHMPLLCLRGS
uniref:Uncharacterized protein n=1 Tax=Arundo donax TaxID=35708 RepID=A0A0A8YYD9_ARUDO